MAEVKHKYKEKPTKNQLNFIKVIEEKLDIKFNGETKKDAAIFIGKNYSVIKRQRAVLRKMWKD